MFPFTHDSKSHHRCYNGNCGIGVINSTLSSANGKCLENCPGGNNFVLSQTLNFGWSHISNVPKNTFPTVCKDLTSNKLCNIWGTDYCSESGDSCFCKPWYTGKTCNECDNGFYQNKTKNADINHEFGEGVICSGKLTKSIYLKIMINTINFY